MQPRKWIVFVVLLFTLSFSVNSSVSSEAVSSDQDEQNLIQAANAMRNSGRVQFNFTDLSVLKFIRFMSELLQQNIIISPSVKGTVTVMSPKTVSLEEARQIMVTTLVMNGLSLEDMGDYMKVVKGGTTKENQARRSRSGPGYGEIYVNQVVPLDFITPAFAQGAVKVAAGKDVSVIPLSEGTGLLLTGKATNVQRLVNLIRALDVPDSLKTVAIVSVKNAVPKVVAAHLAALAKDKAGPFRGLAVTADESSKRLILVGTRQVIAKAKNIVARLDIPPVSGQFHVYRLKNADAQEVSKQLSQILAVAGRLKAGDKGTFPTTVVPDIPTNSLIFAAEDRQYDDLVGIIEQLDTQPKQVMVRGLIAEVNLTNLKNAGIDWATWGGQVAGNTVFAANTQLGGAGVPSTFVDWFQDLSKTEVEDDDGNITTTYTGNSLVYAYVQLLKKFDAINVLSMPRLMCTDNKESNLVVGQVIPQMKASTSDISNPGSVQNSYDYKDTGLKLKITPHIRSGNLVALDIEQSTEDVLSDMTSTTPVTSKREIRTSVQVIDGETIILGGLIKDAEKSMKQSVPGLSYIPLIGNLFKRTVRQKEKIELMVFLTPYILETPKKASAFTREVISGDHGISQAEALMNKRFYELYDEAVKNQDK